MKKSAQMLKLKRSVNGRKYFKIRVAAWYIYSEKTGWGAKGFKYCN